jgi:hypothetical protein
MKFKRGQNEVHRDLPEAWDGIARSEERSVCY